ncbi:MAG: flavodoxin family protein [bacterium]|nr:flavodoxin family protein [bacterium]
MQKYFLGVIMALFLCVSAGFAGDATGKQGKVLITYYSETGNTQQMAMAVAKGARSVKNIRVKLLTVKEAKPADLLWADAIIIGSPVQNANIAAPVMNFIKSWPFQNTPLKDKIGAAFVSAGGISAGEELSLINIHHSMMIFGMIVVGGGEWQSAFGASAITNEKPFGNSGKTKKVAPYFLEKARRLGERVARLVLRFHRH